MSTGFGQVFNTWGAHFDRMYKNRAFQNFYLRDGIEEWQFSESRDTLAQLMADYREISVDYFEYGAEGEGDNDD